MERVAILSPSDSIDSQDIVTVLPNITGGAITQSLVNLNAELPQDLPLKELTEHFEKKVILDILDKVNWNVSKAAEMLKLERSHLYKKMKAFGISRD